MNTNRCKPTDIRETFRFLIDEFGYSVIRDKELSHDGRPYGFEIEYIGNERRVYLSYDYKENFLDFALIRGSNTQYPNDFDRENIRSFWELFRSFESQLELKMLQPVDQTCAEAVSINAQLLKKYASGILRGEEWI